MIHFVIQTPSLQHLAAVKIVATAWNERDICAQIARAFNCRRVDSMGEESNEWKEIEEKVKSNVSVLPLPETCKKQLFKVIKPIGMEIIVWCRDHNGAGINDFQMLDFLLGNPLRWTMFGTIEYKKTAELMVRNERIDIERRYKMACHNCLEEETRQLLRRASEEQYNNIVRMVKTFYKYDDLLAFFSRAAFVSVENRFPSMQWPAAGETLNNRDLFENCLWSSGNRAACEYLFQKLSREEKEQVLADSLSLMSSYKLDLPICNVMYYVSLMNEAQQRSMFQRRSLGVLTRVLQWPWQPLFMETAKRGWDYMEWNECNFTLVAIVKKIRLAFQDFDYSRLFWECWGLTSAERKRFILSRPAGLLKNLIESKREEFMTLILNQAPSLQVENYFDDLGEVLADESAICDAALMECKQTAALESSSDEEDEEKRSRSELLSQLVDIVMERRMERRLAGLVTS